MCTKVSKVICGLQITEQHPYIHIIVNDVQQDANILAYLFIPNQLYMFRVMSSTIIRGT